MSKKQTSGIRWLREKFSSLLVLLLGVGLFLFVFLPIFYIATMSIKSQSYVVSGEFSLIFFKPSFTAWINTFNNPRIMDWAVSQRKDRYHFNGYSRYFGHNGRLRVFQV